MPVLLTADGELVLAGEDLGPGLPSLLELGGQAVLYEQPSLKILDLWRQLQTSCWNEFLFLSPRFQISKENEPLSSRLLLMACGEEPALGCSWSSLSHDPGGRGVRPGGCLWVASSVGSCGPRRSGSQV